MAEEADVPAGGNGEPVTVDDVDVYDADDLAAEAAGHIVPEESIKPWERQPGESAAAYHSFCHYRDTKFGHTQVRSLAKAYQHHKKECMHTWVPEHTPCPKHWRIWSSRWGWVERAARWDDEVDAQFRAQHAAEQVEARKRHARFAQAGLSILTAPVRAALAAAQDPVVIQRLTDHMKIGPVHTLQVLTAISRMVAVAPELVNMERLALGLSTDALEIDDKREDHGLAQRIVADPAATELAIQLLDRLANAGQSPALGPGSGGESGEVVADATSELVDDEVGGVGAAEDYPTLRGDASAAWEE